MHSILHIGDSEKDDVEGAHAAGFEALRIDRGQTAGSNGLITSLEELKRVLGRLHSIETTDGHR